MNFDDHNIYEGRYNNLSDIKLVEKNNKFLTSLIYYHYYHHYYYYYYVYIIPLEPIRTEIPNRISFKKIRTARKNIKRTSK